MLGKLFFHLIFCSICISIDLNYNPLLASQNNQAIILNCIERDFNNKSLSKASFLDLISLVDKYPNNSRAHILLGNCCDSMGLAEQAIQQYKLALKYSPNNVESIIQLIKAQTKAGQLAAARNLLRQAMEKYSDDPQILFLTGNALFKEQRYEEAKQLYIRAANAKSIIGINSALANLSLVQGDFRNALVLAMADLAIDPNLPQANEVAGEALLKLNRFAQALPHLRIAYNNDPVNYKLALNYAQTLIWCGKYDDALMPIINALANCENLMQRIPVNRAIDDSTHHLTNGSIVKTIGLVSSSNSLNKNIFVHIELSKICLNNKLFDLALNEILMAVKIDPHYALAKYKLALFMENYKHDYGSALNYLREARVLEPYNREINLHLTRLEDRLAINKSDWAWRLKDWLTKNM